MRILSQVQELGASIITVTPQLPQRALVHKREAELDFPILHDRGLKVAEMWSLAFTLPVDLRELYMEWGINLPEENGEDSWALPIPASFVVDGDGIVRYRSVDPDYRYRPEPSEAYLPVLRELAG